MTTGNIPTGTVTFLYTDIEGSTRLWQEKPQSMAISHARHDAILRAAIETNHGYIIQIVGDSFSAAFHNAADGLRAALDSQSALQSEQWGQTGPLKVRMGLHTALSEGIITPALGACLDDQKNKVAHHAEEIIILAIAALMVLKPF